MSDGCRTENAWYRWKGFEFKWFLSIFGPCGLCDFEPMISVGLSSFHIFRASSSDIPADLQAGCY